MYGEAADDLHRRRQDLDLENASVDRTDIASPILVFDIFLSVALTCEDLKLCIVISIFLFRFFTFISIFILILIFIFYM